MTYKCNWILLKENIHYKKIKQASEQNIYVFFSSHSDLSSSTKAVTSEYLSVTQNGILLQILKSNLTVYSSSFDMQRETSRSQLHPVSGR